MIEQCTYDGTIYDATMILGKLGHLCDYILFDEAWAGFTKFHPLFRRRFAMGLTPLDAEAPGIIATQSTHKQLASFSQASQIHVRDNHIKGQERRRRAPPLQRKRADARQHLAVLPAVRLARRRRPHDEGPVRRGAVGRHDPARDRDAQEAPPGEARVRADRDRAGPPLVLRPVRAAYRVLAGRPMRPLARATPWEDVPTDDLASNPAFWAMAGNDDWHGFHDVPSGFAMTDPNKLTLLMPGFDRATGAYEDHGVPAPLLAEYLRENRIVCEKNDLHSILFLLTPGVESSKAGTLLSWLVTFKRLHDENARLQDVVPEFVRRRPERYGRLGLHDLCGQMHRFYRDAEISRLQREQFQADHLPELAMTPARRRSHAGRATRSIIVPISQVEGRIAATLMLVYPPGIATIIPGERLGGRATPMIDYLLAFEGRRTRFRASAPRSRACIASGSRMAPCASIPTSLPIVEG